MNLFCFSLEGSTDSLYEPVHTPASSQECNLLSRACSPSPLLLDSARWGGSQPSIATESFQMLRTNSRKKKQKEKTMFPKSALDHNSVAHADGNNACWQSPGDSENASIQNQRNEVLGEDLLQRSCRTGEDRERPLNVKRMEADPAAQLLRYEAWMPTWQQPGRQQMEPGMEPEDRGTLARIQKLVRSKKENQSSLEESQVSTKTAAAPAADSAVPDDSPVMSCMGLGKRTEKKSGKEAQVQTFQGTNGGRAGGGLYATWDPGSHLTQQRWSNSSECPASWDHTHHTCIRTLDLHHPRVYDFSSPMDGDCHAPQMDPLPPQVARSITDLDVCGGTRSTSFGRFDAFRHSSPSKHDENEANLHTEGQQVADGSDQGRTRVLGKMKAISLTMRKRMGRKYAKALSEDMGEEIEREQEAEADGGQPLDKGCRRSSNSLESLYSLNSGRSSSSGVTSGSDGSSNRESLQVEEEVPYTGHICGRARVHTDFVPSPYDTDSLRLKVGDIIDVISKPPMGIWTGVLNNKVGNFKFIYADLIEEQTTSQKSGSQKTAPHRQSAMPVPETLQELLDSLHLEEYTSSLLLNGYQTVEDLKELKEQHLIELNMSDPEHRSKLLAAVDCLFDIEDNEVEEGEGEKKDTTESRLSSGNEKDNQTDCPRDSGCYVTPEGSDNGKDDTYSHTAIEKRPLGES